MASNPKNYKDFVDIISTEEVDFPISLSDISVLEHVNRRSETPIKFRVNVFREDLSNKTIYMVRSSKYKDGMIINVLLVDLEYNNDIISHYVLIDSSSFFKKHYLNKTTGNITSYSKNIFCANCFQQFWTKTCWKSMRKYVENQIRYSLTFLQKTKILHLLKLSTISRESITDMQTLNQY